MMAWFTRSMVMITTTAMSRLTPMAAAPMPMSQPSASRRSRRLTPGSHEANRSTRAVRKGTSRYQLRQSTFR